MKICNDKRCEFGGQPQPETSFHTMPNHKPRPKCKSCANRDVRAKKAEFGVKVDRTCQLESCGQPFQVRVTDVKRGKGKFCSQACVGRAASLASHARGKATRKFVSRSNQSPLYTAHLPRELDQSWPVVKMYRVLGASRLGERI